MTDARLDRLERDVTTLHQDMRDIRSALGQIQVTLTSLPTKRDLTTNTWSGLAVGLAIMGLVVGGIIGGLSWIKPDAAPPTPVTITAPPPIIVQVPASPPQAIPVPTPAPADKKP
ncbi:hypothetical protein [Niveispirillum sp.]|uniref:hypothetical protein n=1 Tax=Niveispirillum sp. TaxID=1917217 RepID=UPI001B6B052B|nr:hypothetical protein [Niveispirillum sp.]MBP7336898.1 hypothetical protein [Niveispirillum sp.]